MLPLLLADLHRRDVGVRPELPSHHRPHARASGGAEDAADGPEVLSELGVGLPHDGRWGVVHVECSAAGLGRWCGSGE